VAETEAPVAAAAAPAAPVNGSAPTNAMGEGAKRRRRRGPRRSGGDAAASGANANAAPAAPMGTPAPVPVAPVGVSKESFLRRLSARVKSWVGSGKPT
jgi:hypothetical protein